jgi:serine/threonine protein phosphatase PrpC
MARIKEQGGRVEPIKNGRDEYVGPYRVWTDDIFEIGLPMSRSIGDYKTHEKGVTSAPQVTDYLLVPGDEAIVLATDGVFEYLSNEEVGDIVRKHLGDKNVEKAANEIVAKADERWRREGAGCAQDDNTCIVVLFD